jgi:hypothetical protein
MRMYNHMIMRYLLLRTQRVKLKGGEQGTKKPLIFRGLAYLLIPLISRNIPPELAPFLRHASGLPGFTGPFPSTSLDESILSCIRLSMYTLANQEQITA